MAMRPKLLLLALLLLLLLFFILVLLLRPIPPSPFPTPPPPLISAASCSKIPESLAAAIVHYATSNSTPQQTEAEISVAARVLRRRSPCRFLLFGLGLDSPMWAALNHGGRTVFLEEDEAWISAVRRRFPSLEAYRVRYTTRVRDADALMEIGRRPECSGAAPSSAPVCGLALEGLPAAFHAEEWDLIMVDGPTGWVPEAPGRMGAIYAAGAAARVRRGEGPTDVFVHDVDRKVEDQFSRLFLCDEYLEQEEGRLRHFSIPSRREVEKKEKKRPGTPFCPSSSL